MKKVIIINGPNLNLLGKREPTIYGNTTFQDFYTELKNDYAKKLDLHYFQSNHEGAIIDKIHEIGFDYDGIVLNGGAFSHYSYAITDAIAAISCPVIEVHISNVHARTESFRHQTVFTAKCKGIISGFGLNSYRLALEEFSRG